jgi:Tol biopolymer transport system component
MDAALSADASKAIIVPHVTLKNAKAVIASGYRIYLINVAAASSKVLVDRTDKVAKPAPGGNSALAPDAGSVAYTDQGLVFIQALDGSAARQLTADPGTYGTLAWSPDGKQILVSTGAKVYLFASSANKDKGQALAAGTTTDVFSQLSWSPDGTQALLSSQHGPTLYVYTFASSKAVKFAPRNLVPDFAEFIPGTSRILFGTVSPKDGTLSLFSANVDGSGLVPVVSSVTTFGIAPDGSRIVYTYLKSVYASNVDGGNGQPIVDGATLLAVQPGAAQ